MSSKVFTANQLPSAIGWLFRCDGTMAILLDGKPYFKDWENMPVPLGVSKESVINYFRNCIDLNISRYGHKEESIKIIITEPELDELIEDF